MVLISQTSLGIYSKLVTNRKKCLLPEIGEVIKKVNFFSIISPFILTGHVHEK
jgi:hypothetical protein